MEYVWYRLKKNAVWLNLHPFGFLPLSARYINPCRYKIHYQLSERRPQSFIAAFLPFKAKVISLIICGFHSSKVKIAL
jgi:hypothetical protein